MRQLHLDRPLSQFMLQVRVLQKEDGKDKPRRKMVQATGAGILNRLLDKNDQGISLPAARYLLGLDFHESDHDRMSQLSESAKRGELKKQERQELEEYLRVADLLGVLQSRARRALRSRGKSLDA